MKRLPLLHLIWLLPVYFSAMIAYQAMVLDGIRKTYEQGESVLARVTDFDIKQIAAQTNGYVDLEFTTGDGQSREERLTLSVQMASTLMDAEFVPIRYLSSSFEPVLMTATYPLHRRVVISNMAMLGLSLLGTLALAVFTSRYVVRRRREGAAPRLVLEEAE